jgi:hypothetical protein
MGRFVTESRATIDSTHTHTSHTCGGTIYVRSSDFCSPFVGFVNIPRIFINSIKRLFHHLIYQKNHIITKEYLMMRITLFLVLALPSLSSSFHLNSDGNGNSLRIHQAPSNHALQYKRSVLFDLRIENIRKEESRPSKEASSPKRTSRSQYSASDWFYNLKTWKNSSVLREIRNPVMALSAWATFVSVVHKVLLMNGKATMAANLCIPPLAHSFLVSSLGLLLVFRTNSAYQRFLVSNRDGNLGQECWSSSYTDPLSFIVVFRKEDRYGRKFFPSLEICHDS